MNILAFTKTFEPLRIFSLTDIRLVEPDFSDQNLTVWASKGYIRMIKKGWYVLADTKIENYDYYLIANRIYSPSYISLELALNHYGVIPEAVMQITSVTTNKTNTFETSLGTFVYKSIKPSLNFGYNIIEFQNQKVKIATLEKAILDLMYLNYDLDSEVDFSEMRFNTDILKETLDFDKLEQYLKLYSSNSLKKRVHKLITYIQNA